MNDILHRFYEGFYTSLATDVNVDIVKCELHITLVAQPVLYVAIYYIGYSSQPV